MPLFQEQRQEKPGKREKPLNQALIEFSLVLLLITVVMMLAFYSLGPWSGDIFGKIAGSITGRGQ